MIAIDSILNSLELVYVAKLTAFFFFINFTPRDKIQIDNTSQIISLVRNHLNSGVSSNDSPILEITIKNTECLRKFKNEKATIIKPKISTDDSLYRYLLTDPKITISNPRITNT